MAPLAEGDYCWTHDPENAESAAEARRLGGLRRRREATLVGAYDLGALDTVEATRRILEIVIADTLSLDNGVARNRTLLAAAAALLKVLEAGDVAARLHALEAVVLRQGGTASLFEPTGDGLEEGE